MKHEMIVFELVVGTLFHLLFGLPWSVVIAAAVVLYVVLFDLHRRQTARRKGLFE